MSRRLLKKGAKNGYIFDQMGWALPRLNDKAVMDALRLVTTQTPVIAKVVPIGEENCCHRNSKYFAESLGGKAIRGYRVELALAGFLEAIDHSVVQVGDEFIDVTPHFGTQKTMFVASDRDLPEISESYIHPYSGHQHAKTKPCFVIPLTRDGQAVAVKSMGYHSAQVEAARLWEEGVLNRAHTIVVRF